MKPNYPILAIATAAQAAFAVAMWLWLVEARPQNVVNQFWGHFGPASLLVLLGMVALIERGGPVAMGTKEAWLAIAGGGIYILADTFIMHPPWGVFDGAGKAEQEHVTIMAMVLMLGVSALAMLRKFGDRAHLSVHFAVAVLVVSMVFLSHMQPTMAGTSVHSATVVFLVLCAALRVLRRTFEYGIALIVTGWIFYSSQMGFAGFVQMKGYSPGAWIALWAMFGFASATIFTLLAPPLTAEDD